MQRIAPDYFGAGRSRLHKDPAAHVNGQPHVGGTTGANDIIYNPNLLGKEAASYMAGSGSTMHDFVTTFLTHEFVHVTVNELAQSGVIDSSWLHNPSQVHRRITRPTLGHQCGKESNCSSGCGLGDAIARKFAECVEQPDTRLEDVRCRAARDYCDDRRFGDVTGHGLPGSCHGSPAINADSECFAVSCSDVGFVSSACCGAMSGGSLPAGIYIPRVDPGPMPPPPALALEGLPWIDGTPLP